MNLPGTVKIGVLDREERALLPDRCVEVAVPGGSWKIEHHTGEGFMMSNVRARQSVIVSAAIEADGRAWLHLSLADHAGRMPGYDDLTWLKRTFLGRNKKAIMVLPSEEFHVNLHPHTLHLFHCLEEVDPLPEFSGELPGVGRSI